MSLRRFVPSHGTAVAYVALFFATSGTAVAATGGTFLLGKPNSASVATGLTNTGTGAALQLTSQPGSPPLSVSNGVKVPLLNADSVDGLDSSGLQRRLTGTCTEGAAVTAVATSGALTCSPAGAGRVLLRHLEPSKFVRPANSTSYDSTEFFSKTVTLSKPSFVQVLAHARITVEATGSCQQEAGPPGVSVNLMAPSWTTLTSAYLDRVGSSSAGSAAGEATWLPAGTHKVSVGFQPHQCAPVEAGSVAMSEIALTVLTY